MVAAIAPSSMNGSWMNIVEAPTSRMIPVSRRRLSADSRIVVVMSRTAASSMTSASPPASSVARLSTENSLSNSRCWSWTSSTPGRPETTSATTWYFFGSVSLMRNDEFMSSTVAAAAQNWSLNCFWKASNACSLDSV